MSLTQPHNHHLMRDNNVRQGETVKLHHHFPNVITITWTYSTIWHKSSETPIVKLQYVLARLPPPTPMLNLISLYFSLSDVNFEPI